LDTIAPEKRSFFLLGSSLPINPITKERNKPAVVCILEGFLHMDGELLFVFPETKYMPQDNQIVCDVPLSYYEVKEYEIAGTCMELS
jgi:hypothetical protein